MIEKVNPSHPDKVADRIAGNIGSAHRTGGTDWYSCFGAGWRNHCGNSADGAIRGTSIYIGRAVPQIAFCLVWLDRIFAGNVIFL